MGWVEHHRSCRCACRDEHFVGDQDVTEAANAQPQWFRRIAGNENEEANPDKAVGIEGRTKNSLSKWMNIAVISGSPSRSRWGLSCFCDSAEHDQASSKPHNFCAAFSSNVRVTEHPRQIPSEPMSASSKVPVPFRKATTAW